MTGPARGQAAFPCGLRQPESGYRCSQDALLLASYAPVSSAPRRVVDLGAGCGVVGFGLLLRCPADHVTGVELQPELAACARENAQALGLSGCYVLLANDLRQLRGDGQLGAGGFDLVLANPPYHAAGRGRLSPHAGRRLARCEEQACLADFLSTAAWLLRPGGLLCLVHRPERLAELLAGLDAARLAARRLRFVHTRPGRPAALVLLEARKPSRPGAAALAIEAPLLLHGPQGQELTAEALAFCPFLRCNRAHATNP